MNHVRLAGYQLTLPKQLSSLSEAQRNRQFCASLLAPQVGKRHRPEPGRASTPFATPYSLLPYYGLTIIFPTPSR